MPRDCNCEWYIGLIENYEDILDVTFFIDEVLFYLSEYINSQIQILCIRAPMLKYAYGLHDVKVVAICRNRIVDTIFIERTVNSDHYCFDILVNFIVNSPTQRLLTVGSNKMVLQRTQQTSR